MLFFSWNVLVLYPFSSLFTWPTKLINVLHLVSYQSQMKLSLLLALALIQYVVTYFFGLFVGEVVKRVNSGVLANKLKKLTNPVLSYQSHWNVLSYRKAMDKADVHWSLPDSSNGVWNCLLHQLHCHLLPCFKSYTLCNHGELFCWRI